MNTSPTIAAIADALGKAQIEMQNPVKDRVAKVKSDKGDYQYNYADLANVLDSVRPVLGRNGIAIVQSPEVAGDVLTVTTRLLHSSGEWIESQLSSGIDPRGKIQTLGSAISYLRRYALQAIVGVVAEEDDDGNQAQGQSAQTQARRPAVAPIDRSAPAAANAATPTPTQANGKAPAAPAAVAPPDPLKPECDDLCVKLAQVSSSDFAKEVWGSGGTSAEWKARRDALRQAHAACAEILTVAGEGRGGELITEIIRRKEPVGTRARLLLSASLGEVPAAAGKGAR